MSSKAAKSKKRAAPKQGGVAAGAAFMARRRTMQKETTLPTPPPAQTTTEAPVSRVPVHPPPETTTITSAKGGGGGLEERVAEAIQSTNHTFYPPTEVSARYAHAQPVREFLLRGDPVPAEGSTPAAEASIVSSMSRAAQAVDQSLSRIDDMIAERQNRLASARVQFGQRAVRNAGAGLNPFTPAGALELEPAEGRALTIDDFVSRVLGIDSIDNIGADLYRAPYQVNGLSRDVPNPEYESLRAQREELEQRREQLQAERNRLVELARVRGTASAAEEARKREELRQQLILFAPIESVQLLKPSSEVRALNERWRNLLGSALLRISLDYENATRAALGGTAASPDALTLYLQQVRNPVLNRYVDELRTSTFEDMPLTREMLEAYFYRFIAIVARAIVHEESTNGEEALARLREQQIDGAGRFFAFGLDITGRRNPDASVIEGFVPEDLAPPENMANATTPADELRMVNAYLRDALYIHATPVYMQWLERWIADVNGREPGALSQLAADTLRASVRKMVEGRDRMYRERIKLLGRALPRYEPPSEAEMVRAYAELVTTDVALERAKVLVEQDEENLLRTAIQRVLRGDLELIDIDLLIRPRVDRFEVLEQERLQIERDLRDTFVSPPDADDRARAYQERALEVSLGELGARAQSVRDQLLQYSPLLPDNTASRAPADEQSAAGPPETAEWSPYDLSYPLDIEKTQRQLPFIQSRVLRQAVHFDAEGMHERNNSLRCTLSYSYDERLIQREILRINYVLEHLALPVQAAPLLVVRSVNDTQRPFTLTAVIDLRDELKVAQRAPDALMRDPRIDEAVDALKVARFEVVWYFRPRYDSDGELSTAPEREIASEVLETGQRVSRVSLMANDTLLPLAGTYRAEFRLRNAGARETVYKSLFTATLRVTARCRRDNAEYEVGSDAFYDCEWREAPRDLRTHEFAEDLFLLVTSGVEAVQEVRAKRAEEREVLQRQLQPIDTTLFKAHWGEDTEAALQQALDRFNIDDFRYFHIFGRIVKRLGTQVRNVLALVPGFRDFLNRHNTDIQLFALLVDATLTGDTPAARIARAAQMVVLAHTAARSWADPKIGDTVFSLQGVADLELTRLLGAANDGDADTLRGLVEAVFDPNTRLPARLPAVFFEPLRSFTSLPVDEIEPLTIGNAPASLYEIPLARMLYAAYAPPLWQNLAAHERRFVHELFDRFERFALEYRERAYLSSHAGVVAMTGNYVPEYDAPAVRAAVLEYGVGVQFVKTAMPPLHNSALGIQVDEDLARMTPSAVDSRAKNWLLRCAFDTRREAGDELEDILLDRNLLAEFNERITVLARRGLVSELEVLERNRVTGRHEVGVVRRVARAAHFDECGVHDAVFANTGGRQMWSGAHSFQTAQPDIYDIVLEEAVGTGEQARIVRRGSIPRGKGYDFEGLHSLISAAVDEYNAVFNDTRTMEEVARARALARIAERVRDLELIYNFLAFVAPRRAADWYVPATEMLAALRSRQEIFDFLQRLAPKNVKFI